MILSIVNYQLGKVKNRIQLWSRRKRWDPPNW